MGEKDEFLQRALKNILPYAMPTTRAEQGTY
jgi:hypothetical protein